MQADISNVSAASRQTMTLRDVCYNTVLIDLGLVHRH